LDETRGGGGGLHTAGLRREVSKGFFLKKEAKTFAHLAGAVGRALR
jgi:hypothetical protein